MHKLYALLYHRVYAETLPVTVAAPLEVLPLFMRAGSLAPMLRPTIDSLAPTSLPMQVDSLATTAGRAGGDRMGVQRGARRDPADQGRPGLYVRAVPGDDAFAVYDGTALTQATDDQTITLTITPGSVYALGAVFEVIAAPTISGVMDGDAPLAAVKDPAALELAETGWVYSAALGGTLHIKVGPGTHTLTATLAP